MELKKKQIPVYGITDDESIIKDAVKHINENRDNKTKKMSVSNFILTSALREAKRILKDIEKGK